jgi:hypothetical protein
MGKTHRDLYGKTRAKNRTGQKAKQYLSKSKKIRIKNSSVIKDSDFCGVFSAGSIFKKKIKCHYL